MSEPLRPLSTGELLDRTLTLYRQNFKLFVGVSILGPIVGLIYSVLFVGSAHLNHAGFKSPVASAGSVGMVMVGLAVMGCGYAISHAAAVKAVAAVYVGRGITIGEAYQSVKGRFWRIIGVLIGVVIRVYGCFLLFGLGAVLLAVAIPGAAKGVFGSALTGPIVGILVGVLLIVLLIAALWFTTTLFARYALSIQACVVEDLPAKQALKRSAFLAKGSRSRILTVYTVFLILTWVVVAGLGALLAVFSKHLGPVFSVALNQLATLISGIFTAPLATIAMSLVYYDERVRKEAFDLQLMMDSLDSTQPASTLDPVSSAPIG
jgi:hypothetical protein